MKIRALFLIILFFFIFSSTSFANYDPKTQPNNKYGVHILFPIELKEAAELVNSSGGDWGYVTIPIQQNDKDIVKWQSFMDEAKKLHLIPIVRLSTNGDYFNTAVWEKPTYNDVLDFANFLDSLEWPTKNRYILVYNEVNRADEWGGQANPEEYANILSYSVTAFKTKNPDFFVISAGLDNAAPNQGTKYMNQYAFINAMNRAVPGIFNQVDGISSHSYPNPGFSQNPYYSTNMNVHSFLAEKALIESMSSKKLPVFITETGWDAEVVDEKTVCDYLTYSFNNVWNNEDIIAVTPFILKAGAGPFQKFCLIDGGGAKNAKFETIRMLPKIKGTPLIPSEKVLGKESGSEKLPVKKFKSKNKANNPFILNAYKTSIKWLLRI